MKNLILITFALILGLNISFAQITVKAPNGDVGVGMDNPSEKLSVAGRISVLGTGIDSGVFGEDDSRRIALQTNLTAIGSSAYITMFGNETQPGGTLSRAGEFNLIGNEVIIRSGKAVGNFGTLAFEIKSNNDLFAHTQNTFKIGNTKQRICWCNRPRISTSKSSRC